MRRLRASLLRLANVFRKKHAEEFAMEMEPHLQSLPVHAS
jgi:hypothetical protein